MKNIEMQLKGGAPITVRPDKVEQMIKLGYKKTAGKVEEKAEPKKQNKKEG